MALAALSVWAGDRTDWAWQADLVAAQPWRAVTAAGVHWSNQHLMLNLAGLAVLALWAAATRVTPRAALAWALAWPLTHVVLLLRPDLPLYGGLSGVLHAGALVATLPLLASTQPLRVRVFGAVALCAITGKVLLEQPWGPATVMTAHLDVPVAPMGHMGGLLAALLAWGLVAGGSALWRWRSRPLRVGSGL